MTIGGKGDVHAIGLKERSSQDEAVMGEVQVSDIQIVVKQLVCFQAGNVTMDVSFVVGSV